ncbi:MAG: crossover junction endodeoxyribonuclease RuvC [Bacteroidota bacterium]
MIILGVDPGTLVTGYGVIETRSGSVRVLAFDVVKNGSERSMPLRLKRIYAALTKVIAAWHPDEFAIETAFYGKNAQSALKIGHARGVSILAAVNAQVPTTEYSPREIKKAIVGNGAASKQQVQAMVKNLLRLKVTPKLFDATDALAVALCHSHRLGNGSPRTKFPATRRRPFTDWKSYVETHPERVAKRP